MGDDLAPRATAPGLEPVTASQSGGQSAVQSAKPAPSAHGLPPGAVILEQDFDSTSLYALRSAVSAHGADVGMGTSRLYDVVTAAHELAANAVRHGAGRGHLRLWVLDGILHCEVSDAGRPASGDTGSGDTGSGDTGSGDSASGDSASGGTVPGADASGADASGGGSAAWRSEHGHGLWVVGQIADQFTIDRGNRTGTIATAAFSLGLTPDLPARHGRAGPLPEAGNESALPGCLHRAGGVVVPDVSDRLPACQSVQDGQAGQRGASSPVSACAGDLDALGPGARPRLPQRVGGASGVRRQPEVRPA